VSGLGQQLTYGWRALKNPDIRRVQLAWTGCISAETAQTVGLAVVAYRAGGLFAVAALGLTRTIPAAVVGPLAVTLVDRRPRARVLMLVLGLRGLLAACIAATVAASLPTVVVLAIAAADAVVYSVWWPTQSAVLPELADSPDEATSANVLTTVIENTGTLLGPLLGAALLAVADEVTTVFATAAVLLNASAIALGALAWRSTPPTTGADEVGPAGTFAGFRVALRERHPRTVIALYLLQTFGLGILGVLVVGLAVEVLDLGEAGIGVLNASVGAGGLVGAMASAALVGRRRLGSALGLALLLWSAGFALAGSIPAAAVGALAAVGIANGLVDVAGLTLLQRTVHEALLVRVLGVFEGLWWAALGTGAMAGAAVVEVTGLRSAFVLVAVVVGAATLACTRALRRVDAVAGPPPEILRTLASVPFFRPLPPVAIERLAFSAVRRTVTAGTPVISAGEQGDAFYVVEHGMFDVAVDGRRSPLAEPFFGEIALLHDVRRTATVTAVTDADVLVIERDRFLGALALDISSHEEAARHVRSLPSPPVVER
jgi:MFS family permease